MSETLIVNSALTLHRALNLVSEEWDQHRYLRLTIRSGSDRSLSQNALSHVWYGQIAKCTYETPEDVKCECKLRFGVPILRSEDEDFREMYDACIKRNLTYEQKLKAMRFLPVTSLMTKEQLSKYLEAVNKEYADRGIELQWPEKMEAA